MLVIKRRFSKVISFVLALFMLFACGVNVAGLNIHTAEEVEGYNVVCIDREIIFGSPYLWEDEAIQSVASSLPEYTVEPLFESADVYTYLITLEDGEKNKEACDLLKTVSGVEFVITNYFYANDTDAIHQMQVSDDYHKGDLDGDNELTTSDYLNVKQSFIGEKTLGKKESVMADIDNNGEVSATDYLMIKSHFLGDIEISKDGFYGDINVSEYKANINSLTELNMAMDYVEFRNFSSEYMYLKVSITGLLASSNGAHIVKVGNRSIPELNITAEKEIGGVTLNIPLCADMLVWKDGSFYSLEDAFEQNLISANELEIANCIYKTTVATMKVGL